MKFSKHLSFIAISFLLVFAVSCKVTYPTEKYLQGKWTPIKVEKYVEPGTAPAKPAKSKSTAVKTAVVDTTAGAKVLAADAMTPETDADITLNRMIVVEQRATLEVFTDKKMVIKDYQRKVAKATYKLKKKGYVVNAKEIDSGKKLTLEILSINDTSAVVVERFPFGDIKIEYQKVK
jgi:hypothetical protein